MQEVLHEQVNGISSLKSLLKERRHEKKDQQPSLNPGPTLFRRASAQSPTKARPCASCNWLLHPTPTSAQDGLAPLQLALVVVFILPSISAKTSLALAVGITCNLHWWCFSAPTSTFTNVHTWLAMLSPPTATCTGSLFPLPTRHLILCTWALALRGGGKCMIIHTRAETNVHFSIRSFIWKKFECFEALLVMLIVIQISTLVIILHCDVTSAIRNQDRNCAEELCKRPYHRRGPQILLDG